MSDAFEKVMNAKPDDSSTSSPGGRPKHEHWFGFKKLCIDGKVTVQCLNCLKTYASTHSSRLEKHR